MSNEIERALAALAVDHKAVTATVAVDAIREARQTGRPLAEIVAASVPEADLLRPIAKEMGLRFYDMHAREQEYLTDERILRRCDMQLLTRHSAMPLVDRTGRVVVAMANPMDLDILTYLRAKFPEQFSVALVPKAQVQSRLLYLANDFDSTQAATGANAVPDWVEYILSRAVAEGASDLHLRFQGDGSLIVRLRVDGVLRQIPFPLKTRENEVIGTMLSKCPTMDSSNLREPQDGTFSFSAAGRPIDARVAMIPQITGPNVVVRILDSQTLRKRPEDMGFNPAHLATMRSAIENPQGCIIVVGPTGSGKTTTLYSLLREIDAVTRNVLTVEDPVEYRLPYVGQTQIRGGLGERSLTFPKALRSIVRLDPDVILVGEVRDLETARTAMDASITGHLVLTTLHAHNAPGAFLRLTEMGLPPFLVADAVSLIISQRLVRQVHECSQMGPPTPADLEILQRWNVHDVTEVAQVVGCAGCAGAGFRGRLAVAEVLAPTMRMRTAVATRTTKEDLLREATAAGWRPILEDGLRLVRLGKTTVAELARVLAADEEMAAEDAAALNEPAPPAEA